MADEHAEPSDHADAASRLRGFVARALRAFARRGFHVWRCESRVAGRRVHNRAVGEVGLSRPHEVALALRATGGRCKAHREVNGMPVAVDLAATPSGLSATRIVAIGPPPPAPPLPEAAQATVTGAVTARASETWTVGGTTIYISPKTAISGAPAVGDTAVVTGIKTTEGAIIASTIRKP